MLWISLNAKRLPRSSPSWRPALLLRCQHETDQLGCRLSMFWKKKSRRFEDRLVHYSNVSHSFFPMITQRNNSKYRIQLSKNEPNKISALQSCKGPYESSGPARVKEAYWGIELPASDTTVRCLRHWVTQKYIATSSSCALLSLSPDR